MKPYTCAQDYIWMKSLSQKQRNMLSSFFVMKKQLSSRNLAWRYCIALVFCISCNKRFNPWSKYQTCIKCQFSTGFIWFQASPFALLAWVPLQHVPVPTVPSCGAAWAGIWRMPLISTWLQNVLQVAHTPAAWAGRAACATNQCMCCAHHGNRICESCRIFASKYKMQLALMCKLFLFAGIYSWWKCSHASPMGRGI